MKRRGGKIAVKNCGAGGGHEGRRKGNTVSQKDTIDLSRSRHQPCKNMPVGRKEGKGRKKRGEITRKGRKKPQIVTYRRPATET